MGREGLPRNAELAAQASTFASTTKEKPEKAQHALTQRERERERERERDRQIETDKDR